MLQETPNKGVRFITSCFEIRFERPCFETTIWVINKLETHWCQKIKLIENITSWQVAASSWNPSFLIVHKSINADLITRPPSARGVHTVYCGCVLDWLLFFKSLMTDMKLGKPGILSLFSRASEKILLLVISPTNLVSYKEWQIVPAANLCPLQIWPKTYAAGQPSNPKKSTKMLWFSAGSHRALTKDSTTDEPARCWPGIENHVITTSYVHLKEWDKIEAMVDEVGWATFAKNWWSRMSRGEQQVSWAVFMDGDTQIISQFWILIFASSCRGTFDQVHS